MRLDDNEIKDDLLVGRKVVGLEISKDRKILKIIIDNYAPVFLCAVGECCSESWFAHIGGIEFLVGGTVRKISTRDMSSADVEDEENYQALRHYGYCLSTEKGVFDIELRNQSNGYYGGHIRVGNQQLDQYGDAVDDEDFQKTAPLEKDF